jgi:hypothetical protein
MQNDSDISGQFDLADLESKAEPVDPQSTLGQRVSRLVDDLQRKEIRVKICEADLAQAKADVKSIEEDLLPKLLAEIGSDGFTTSNGVTVEVKEDVHASLPKEDLVRRHAGLKWLADNGHGAIIKHVTTASFAKGDAATARAFSAYVEAFERRALISVETAEDVHHATLAKLVREQRAEGAELPAEILGIHVRRVARVKKRGAK